MNLHELRVCSEHCRRPRLSQTTVAAALRRPVLPLPLPTQPGAQVIPERTRADKMQRIPVLPLFWTRTSLQPRKAVSLGCCFLG